MAQPAIASKRKRSLTPPEEATALAKTIYRSAPIKDRSSTFIGFYSPTLKPKELQAISEANSADHRIIASRRRSNQQSISGTTKHYISEHDDDGEKYAGKKVEKVLESMDVTGACLVARWWGGVMLGPARFEHIEKVAREAVGNWKFAVEEEQTKKRKVANDKAEFERLTEVLVQRDQSIEVLRKLATEKEAALRRSKDKSEEGNGSDDDRKKATASGVTDQASKTVIDYKSMTLDRLRVLEKGRDATLSFLLKRIDKAEAEVAKLIDGG